MKVKNQNIPPEILRAYRKLFTAVKPGLPNELTLRITKSGKSILTVKPPKKTNVDIVLAVDFLIEYLKSAGKLYNWDEFKLTQIQALKKGNFDTLYWKKCVIKEQNVYISYPTSTPWNGPRNYAYPNPNNQPTTPVYPMGVLSDGNPEQVGSTINKYFADTFLRWTRYIFTLANSLTASDKEPLFIKINGSIQAAADQRAARALLSMNLKSWLVTNDSPRLTTTEPPVSKAFQVYYRYRKPRTIERGFAITKPVKAQYSMRRQKKSHEVGKLENAVVLISPMPMMGRRYNNNFNVSSSLNVTPELWQIKKASGGFYFPEGIYGLDSVITPLNRILYSWVYFTNQSNGIMFVENPDPSKNMYFLLDGQLNETEWIPPWAITPAQRQNKWVTTVTRSSSGFTVTVQDPTLGYIEFWFINEKGELIEKITELTNPRMSDIYTQDPSNVTLMPEQNFYALNHTILTGQDAVYVYDRMANLITVIDLSRGPFYFYRTVKSSNNKLFTHQVIEYGTIYKMQIWEIYPAPFVLFCEIIIQTNSEFRWGFFENAFYLYDTYPGRPAYKITMTGEITKLPIPSTTYLVSYAHPMAIFIGQKP